MATPLKEKVAEAMETPNGKGETVGDRVAERTERGADIDPAGCCGNGQGIAGIQNHMDIIAACGTKVGVVDRIQGGTIKLTNTDSPDGQHHFIPTEWVDHVDNHVHLSKSSIETRREWAEESRHTDELSRKL